MSNSGFSTIFWENQNFHLQQDDCCRVDKVKTRLSEDFNAVLKSIKRLAAQKKIPKKTIFLSYAWPMPEKSHEDWVQLSLLKLWSVFTAAGLSCYIDVMNSEDGAPSMLFMQEIEKVDYVLLACSETLQYKDRFRLQSMLHEELGLIESKWRKTQVDNPHCVIPCVFSGEYYDAVPHRMHGRIAARELRLKSFAMNIKDLIALFYNFQNEKDYQTIWNNFFEQHPDQKKRLNLPGMKEKLLLKTRAVIEDKLQKYKQHCREKHPVFTSSVAVIKPPDKRKQIILGKKVFFIAALVFFVLLFFVLKDNFQESRQIQSTIYSKATLGKGLPTYCPKGYVNFKELRVTAVNKIKGIAKTSASNYWTREAKGFVQIPFVQSIGVGYCRKISFKYYCQFTATICLKK